MSDQREAVAAALHRRGEGGKETWERAVEDQAPGTWGLVDYYREWADEIMEALTPDCGVETRAGPPLPDEGEARKMSQMVQSTVVPYNVHVAEEDAHRAALEVLKEGAPVFIWRVAPDEFTFTAIPESVSLPSTAELVRHEHAPGFSRGGDARRARCGFCEQR